MTTRGILYRLAIIYCLAIIGTVVGGSLWLARAETQAVLYPLLGIGAFLVALPGLGWLLSRIGEATPKVDQMLPTSQESLLEQMDREAWQRVSNPAYDFLVGNVHHGAYLARRSDDHWRQ